MLMYWNGSYEENELRARSQLFWLEVGLFHFIGGLEDFGTEQGQKKI